MLAEIYKTLRDLYRLFTPDQKRGGYICLAIMIILGLTEILAAALIVTMAKSITTPDGQSNLITLSLACLLVFIFKGAASLLDTYMQNKWIQSLILDLKQRLIKRYIDMDYARQTARNSAYSLSVLHNDADIYMRIGLTSVGILLSESIVCLVLMSFLIYLQAEITLLLIGLFAVLSFAFIKKFLPIYKNWGRQTQTTAEQGYKEALQIFQSFIDIRIFSSAGYFIERFMKQSRLRAQVVAKAAVAQIVPRISIEIIFILFFAVLVLSFTLLGKDFNDLTLVLSAYLYAGLRLLPGLNRMIIQLNNIKMTETNIHRVIDEMNSPFLENKIVDAPTLTFKRNIALQNISYIYPNTDRVVLNNVSATINKDEFVGIVGQTGSGKSTMLQILLGLITPEKGTATLDGQYPLNSHQWQNKIGYVAQNFSMIDGTIVENIAFGLKPEERDHTLLKQTIKAAQLEALIERLPESINTQVGEGGAMISGGERQRIALARALYRKPEVLILDEATSALDLTTESSIMETIQNLRDGNLTIIAVTHRPDTLKYADRILVMEDGKLTEKIYIRKNDESSLPYL